MQHIRRYGIVLHCLVASWNLWSTDSGEWKHLPKDLTMTAQSAIEQELKELWDKHSDYTNSPPFKGFYLMYQNTQEHSLQDLLRYETYEPTKALYNTAIKKIKARFSTAKKPLDLRDVLPHDIDELHFQAVEAIFPSSHPDQTELPFEHTSFQLPKETWAAVFLSYYLTHHMWMYAFPHLKKRIKKSGR